MPNIVSSTLFSRAVVVTINSVLYSLSCFVFVPVCTKVYAKNFTVLYVWMSWWVQPLVMMTAAGVYDAYTRHICMMVGSGVLKGGLSYAERQSSATTQQVEAYGNA